MDPAAEIAEACLMLGARRYGDAKLPVWKWVARFRLTWPLTVSCSLKKVVVSCVLPTRGLVSSGCGPDFQLVLGKQTSAINSLSGC